MDRSNSHAATQNEQAARFAAEALKLRQVFRLGLTLPHSDLQTDTLKARADERFEAYRSSHSVAVLEEVIGLYEEILRQRPVGHERRAESLNDLGDALYHFCCHHEADETRNKRCIELLREALLLRPPGHPLRDQSLHNLARSLRVVFYSRLGLDILPECESLDREALQLRPPGHPERSKSLNSLAINLAYIVQHTGDVEMQAEVISMHREVLRMRPPGHPQRDSSLNNLGGSLLISFESLGGSDILAEGISLLREALKLRPVGHRLRYTTLDNLANALSQRSHYECHSESLPEAIALQREALPLHPAGHPMQAGSKMNFALFLLDSFRVSRDGRALGEAISLLREAVSSCLVGSFGYEVARQSLAEVLEAKFDEDGDMYALSEAADLHREHLYGRVAEKTLRLQSLEGLARVLWRSGSSSWPEALSCYQEARRLCPVAYPDRARLLSGMSRCFLEIGSPFFDFAEGISCLLEAYSDTYSHVTGRLRLALTDLQRVEAAYSASAEGPDPRTSPKDAERVLDLYTQIIGLLPLAANFGLDHRARLQALTGYDAIARDAAARAVLLGIPSLAVTMLEQGRGVFWMQTLHLRTSAFNEVPEDDCQELERMLRLLEHGARKVEAQGQSTVQHERELEERRQLNEAVQALLTKIRGYPGLDGFLLPPAFDALFGSLPEGFVVIVNASKLGHHALLLHRATGLATSLALKLFRTSFDCAQLKNQLPRDMSSVTEQGSEDKTRAMRKKEGKARCFDDVLSLLWTSVVQPVLDELRLSVSADFCCFI
jgi:tetratricopeptide (TPR) repeat protein